MKRLTLIVLILALALAGAGTAGVVGIVRHDAVTDRVYTVAQLRSATLVNPGQWAGRVVLVRGRLVVMFFDCPYAGRLYCPGLQWDEIDPDVPGSRPLIVTLAPDNPVLVTIHGLPLVGHFFPTSGPPREGPGIFRIRLRTTPRCPFPSANPSCANAVLLAPAQ